MTNKELSRLIQTGCPPVIIDVRSKAEYRSGHIPGALHIPLFRMLVRLARYPQANDKTVVLTCEHGPRAIMAKPLVAKRGYKKIDMLEGHMSAWRKAGLPVEK